MKVIGYYENSRPGNDCYINESWSFCESFGIYFIIHTYKVRGWSSTEDVSIVAGPTTNVQELKQKWKNIGGMSIETLG